MTELRKCAFCGSSKVSMHGHRSSASWVECYDCATSGPVAADKDKAARLWNTRVSDGLVTELVEAGEAMREIMQDNWPNVGSVSEVERMDPAWDALIGWERLVTRAREAGYGQPAEPSSPPTPPAE